jgi:amino acid transporter
VATPTADRSLRAGRAGVAGPEAPDATGRSRAGEAACGGAPLSGRAFAAVAVCSFGGPLALAALVAPGLAADAGDSAGLAMVAAVVVFAAPLAIWLRYARHIAGPGGLYGFVDAAAGRRVALAQAAIWTFSYLLYVVYTTVQIVYDLLPAVLPSERRVQSALAVLIPVALAAVMIAGRRAALLVLGVMAVGQVTLAGVLDAVTVAQVTTPVSAFGTGAPAGSLATAGAQTSLLYVCGSLPLFLGGEVTRPARTIRRGLIGAYALTGLVVVLAVAPLAGAPGVLRTAVPGVSVMAQFAGSGAAKVLGVGIAVSVAGVMLCEYLALTRLAHAVTGMSTRSAAAVIGVVIVAAAPLSLLGPQAVYDALLQPSLVALWISQLIVFAVYPRFAVRRGGRRVPAWSLGVAASALAVYGLWVTVVSPAG